MTKETLRTIPAGAPAEHGTPSGASREGVVSPALPGPRAVRQRLSLSRRIVISQVQPQVEAGRYPIQRVVGDVVQVQANVMCDGDVVLNACILYRVPGESRWRHAPMQCDTSGLHWTGLLRLQNGGRTQYGIEAWVDGFSTWLRDVRRCLDDDEGVAEDTNGEATRLTRLCHTGAAILDAALSHASGADLRLLAECAEPLRDAPMSRQAMQQWLKNRELRKRMLVHDERRFVTRSEVFPSVVVDRKRAVFAAWCRFKGDSATSTLSTDTCRQWARTGCEVLHIGPLAQPHLLEAYSQRVRSQGMELAVDIALPQPLEVAWRREHPWWFAAHDLDFWCEDRDALWDACYAFVMKLVESGAHILVAPGAARVPLPFWEWLIARIKKQHPDVLFVTGAMSREQARAMAWMGFSQSPQIWQNTDAGDVATLLQTVQVTDSVGPFRPFVELASPEPAASDTGLPRPLALLLAATLSPTYALSAWPTQQEQQDWLRQLNRWRRDNRALQLAGNLQILECSNPHVLAFWRGVPQGRNDIIVVVNLRPSQVQEAMVKCPAFPDALHEDGTLVMEDLIDAARYTWHAGSNPLRLDPIQRFAHVLRVVRRPRLLL